METWLNSRKQVIEILKDMQKRGYKYVVRDSEGEYLVCFSLKPKRYMDCEGWGYVDPTEKGVIPAYPIKNTDITEINFKNRSAKLIADFITENER